MSATIVGSGGSLNFEQNQQGFIGAPGGQLQPQGSYIGDALFAPPRVIGTIIPDVLIEEVLRFELEITQHPVERRAPITDHSYRRPTEISMRVGWSNSGQYPGYIDDVYATLRTLQDTRQPFTVLTPRDFYENMLIASLIMTSNGETGEFSTMVQMLLKQIIIVDTQAIQVQDKAKADAPVAPEQPSKTSHVSTKHAAAPKVCTPATNTALNTQSSAFSNADGLLFNTSGPTITPLLGTV